MRFLSQLTGSSSKHAEIYASTSSSQTSPSNTDKPASPDTIQQEHVTNDSSSTEWKLSKTGDGDTAMAVFKSPLDLHTPYTAAEEKALIRKIDLMILPYLAVCYAFFYIDKTTLSYAAIFGIREDLNLVGNKYNWLSSIFYFGFLAWAFPTNFLMQRLPVGKYLGANIFMWGVFLMMQAAAKNFAGLAALRAISGAAEACSDPAFMLITSMWYTRREQPVRIGLWYTANGFGIALGGLLGYAIGHIRGALASWKYEFLIIGALCSTWGIVMIIFLPDTPVTAPGLTPRQRLVAVERLRSNQTGIENKTLKPYQIWEAVLDPKTWFFFILGAVHNTPNGGISNFGTLIIKGFGYSTLVTTLLQVPYGVLIALFILSCVYLNDWTATRKGWNTRCWFILLYTMPNIAGTFGLRYIPQQHHVARLMCYYLTGSYNASFVLVLSLTIANTSGHTKKVVTNSFLFLGYCVGNIAGPFFYRTNQAPGYELGIWSMIFCHLAEVVIVLTFRAMMSWENARRDRLGGGRTDTDRTAFGDLTDRENMNFRYVY
ncbi:putative MFS allantoate transporter [Pseudovirgaria hyperparasitica]|uniref:Putative MFS allantoate transporter n=1 Tax=Pseudovirgaria hyperparasitica TaxID=470096 RepID=A0A6A6W2V9_9PEZI|nr:putative MFS allantoate transporter [Pseudovirgaria hyperparasitica]KAF2757192.1 putative MFS allantoate transporter [Pseudovirgaria hyperparasitica]